MGRTSAFGESETLFGQGAQRRRRGLRGRHGAGNQVRHHPMGVPYDSSRSGLHRQIGCRGFIDALAHRAPSISVSGPPPRYPDPPCGNRSEALDRARRTKGKIRRGRRFEFHRRRKRQLLASIFLSFPLATDAARVLRPRDSTPAVRRRARLRATEARRDAVSPWSPLGRWAAGRRRPAAGTASYADDDRATRLKAALDAHAGRQGVSRIAVANACDHGAPGARSFRSSALRTRRASPPAPKRTR